METKQHLCPKRIIPRDDKGVNIDELTWHQADNIGAGDEDTASTRMARSIWKRKGEEAVACEATAGVGSYGCSEDLDENSTTAWSCDGESGKR